MTRGEHMEEKMITELLSAIQKVLPAMQDYHKMIQHQGELIVQIQKMNISIQNIERNIINHDHDLRGIELKFTKRWWGSTTVFYLKNKQK